MLENQVGPGTPRDPTHEAHYATTYTEDGQPLRYGEGHHPMMSSRPQESRKRAHSILDERESLRDPALTRAGDSWSGAPRNQDYPPRTQQYTSEDDTILRLAGHREPGQIDLRGPPRESQAYSYEADAGPSDVSHVEWDDACVDEYGLRPSEYCYGLINDRNIRHYQIIDSTFPFLPHSKRLLQHVLATCSTTLREAFLLALDCAVRTSTASALPDLIDPVASIQKASELISKAPYEMSQSRDSFENTVYVQALILMVIASDSIWAATGRGPPPAKWLGRAIGKATDLNFNRSTAEVRPDGEADLNAHLRRRIWLVLVVLDRFNASSTSSIFRIPDDGALLMAEDRPLLGETAYHLARMNHLKSLSGNWHVLTSVNRSFEYSRAYNHDSTAVRRSHVSTYRSHSSPQHDFGR